jgi:hypothetical protein
MTLSAPGVTVDFPTQMHSRPGRSNLDWRCTFTGLVHAVALLSPKNVLAGKVAVITCPLLVRRRATIRERCGINEEVGVEDRCPLECLVIFGTPCSSFKKPTCAVCAKANPFFDSTIGLRSMSPWPTTGVCHGNACLSAIRFEFTKERRIRVGVYVDGQ